ncbi:glycosyltransferase [Actinoplanes sp. TBRC 11911]|uniref:glycosyltransferase n=1 Tax=Actinoplanes sp. TBRC 11911 TaxID=2729386 RepID=UPI00145EA3B7|nr:glycosyltransferase [Actinoplanes sp. TBRC 11911]NMO56393.1 glycosyltransferase [Actinoplanes sp. TBRC 11911]
MRVLHVIGAAAADAGGHQLRMLVRRLPHQNEVVTLTAGGPVAAAIRASGVPVHELDTAGDRHLTVVRKLRRLMRRGRFDLVHTHLFRAGVPGRAAARWAGVPVAVATEHRLPRVPGVLFLAGRRYAQVTVTASDELAEPLRRWGVPGERIEVIPRAVDMSEFRYDPAVRAAVRARLGIGDRTPVVGGVGRLEPRKQFERLIRAIGEVPGATLLLVGDGPARAALEGLAAIEGVADRVLFAGQVPHAREMLCAMDIFASPATDTFGLVVLEAMAAGLPALFGSCTPLAGRTDVDDCRRLSPHDPESLPRALRTEVLLLDERHGERLPARSAGKGYEADQMALSVGRIYDRFGPG